MRKTVQETPLSRRMRELEEEERALQQHMRSLARAARKGGQPLGSTLAAGARQAPHARSAADAGAMASPEPMPEESNVGEGREPSPAAQPSPRPAPMASSTPANVLHPRRAAPEDGRFTKYFASGSFGKSRPLGHEKRLQRNKAIFMVIFVILVGSVVYRLFF